MIYGLVLTIHVLIALFLIAVILLQGGRGGLGEALGGAAAQSLFGGGANIVMTKITAVCATLFVITCLSLARLSSVRGRSVIDQLPTSQTQLPIPLPKPSASTSQQSAAKPLETSGGGGTHSNEAPSTSAPSPATPAQGTGAPAKPTQ